MFPFMCQRRVSMTFFTDCCTRKVFLLLSSCFSTPLTVFSIRFVGANRFLANLLKFFTKICFSEHITLSSLSFSWFALLSYQIFDDRPLFDLLPFWRGLTCSYSCISIMIVMLSNLIFPNPFNNGEFCICININVFWVEMLFYRV